MTDTERAHAVVLGASMAGLLAARVLAEHYDRVIVIDRDPLPSSIRPRPGVPHGAHLHALQPRGLQIMEELFDGVTDELVSAGAVVVDPLERGRVLLSGHRFRPTTSGLRLLPCSRPLLEGLVRARVRALPQVLFLTAAITGLTSSPENDRIIGVRIAPSRCPERAVPADLVVDATGRGSRSPLWLAGLGYPRPDEDRVEIGIGYATRTFRLRPGALGGDQVVITGGTPDQPRSGTIAELEGGRHMLTLSGILGDHPPTDLGGFAAFARSLTFPDIADALEGAEALDDGVAFRFPASVRRRYEKLAAHPDRLLVTGDAVCSFNPVYAQGMTVAALEAATLRAQLADRPVPDPRRWYRAIARVIDSPWQVAVGADLVFPGVPGRRTAPTRFINSYLARLHAGASVDPELGLAFGRVLGMVDPPGSLLRPDRLLRVAAAQLRLPRAPQPAPTRSPVAT